MQVSMVIGGTPAVVIGVTRFRDAVRKAKRAGNEGGWDRASLKVLNRRGRPVNERPITFPVW